MTDSRLIDIFHMGNPIHYRLLQWPDHWDMVAGHLSPSLLKRHMGGDVQIGTFAHDQLSHTTNFLSWTTSAKGSVQYARSLMKRLCEILHPLQPAIAWHGGDLYTAYIFLSEPMKLAEAIDIASYIAYKVAPALSYTPIKSTGRGIAGMLRNWTLLPLYNGTTFIDPRQGFELGQPDDTALDRTYSPDDVLRIRQPTPDLTLAQQQALSFEKGSVYPILLDWITENPGEASTLRPMRELYPLLQNMAERKGHVFNWPNQGALALHMRGRHVGEALRKYMGMVRERRYDRTTRQHVLWYGFYVPESIEAG